MTATVQNLSETQESSLVNELSMNELDEVSGGFLPLAVVGAVAGIAVAGAVAAGVGVYLGVKLYEATSGKTVSLAFD
jgi:lactobin A/cerein 7B family class IIb bacteriocin